MGLTDRADRLSIAGGVAVVVITSLAIGLGADAVGRWRDREPSPPPADGFVVDAVDPEPTPPPAEAFVTREVERGACPESRFECITITVPRDHDDPGGDEWQITYAVQPAAVERRGVFVTITGGPGSAGIASADSYADYMAADITDYYDVVFLNQRGSSTSDDGWLRCDQAIAGYYDTSLDVEDPTARDGVAAALQQFVDDCVAESGVDPADLPYYGTAQAALDLEQVRQHLGVEQLVLYGESYGTQFVQTYAAAEPERVAALFLDGPVDLTTDALRWYDEAGRAYSDVLVQVLAECGADELCAADAVSAADPLAAYDVLAERLADGPVAYQLPMPDGTAEPRELTLEDLQSAAGANMGYASGRSLFVRVLNEASAGNYVPLARLALHLGYLDPETLEVLPDPSFSDALFYAVECQDYVVFPGEGTPRERLDRWLDSYTAGDTDELRLGTVALGDLPCLFWPSQPTTDERPTPRSDAPYPTYVLTADTDPNTPTVNAMRIFGRIDDAYLVVLRNGPHVIFNWGFECVDDLVTAAIANGQRPPTRVTICDGSLLDPYAPTSPQPDELDELRAEPLDALQMVHEQLLNSVEVLLWADDEPLEFGCDFGGTARFEATDVGSDAVLSECEVATGYAVSGTAVIDDESGVVEFDIRTPDGAVEYRYDGETASVTGQWQGQAVDDER